MFIITCQHKDHGDNLKLWTLTFLLSLVLVGGYPGSVSSASALSYLANLNNFNVVQSNLQTFKSIQGHNLLASGEAVDSQAHAGLLALISTQAGRAQRGLPALLNEITLLLISLVFLYLAHIKSPPPPQISELGKVAVGNNMRGQREPLGPARTGHTPAKQYGEFRAAENTELRSELFKSLQNK